MPNSYELKDKVVVITGGAIGIGAHTVEMFLDEGVKHVAFLDILEQEGAKHQDTLTRKYGAGKVEYHKCDVTREEQILAAFRFVLDTYGYIDVVVNNAGVMNDQIYKREIDINVTALVTSTFKAIELMRKDQGGRGGVVVNIASIAAMMQTHTLPVYVGTKSFVLQFTNCIGMQEYYAKTGVRVIAMCFGRTDTSLLAENNMLSYDPKETGALVALVESIPNQKPESAARGVIEACRRGDSGSTWLAQVDRPAQDITAKVKEAYTVLQELLG